MSWLVVFDGTEGDSAETMYVRPDLIVAVRVERIVNFERGDRHIAALRTQQGGTLYGRPCSNHKEALLDAGEYMLAIDTYVRERPA